MMEKSNLQLSDGAVTWIWMGNKWVTLPLWQQPAFFARGRCEADEAVQQQARVGGAGGRGGQRHRAGGDDKVTAGSVSRHTSHRPWVRFWGAKIVAGSCTQLGPAQVMEVIIIDI